MTLIDYQTTRFYCKQMVLRLFNSRDLFCHFCNSQQHFSGNRRFNWLITLRLVLTMAVRALAWVRAANSTSLASRLWPPWPAMSAIRSQSSSGTWPSEDRILAQCRAKGFDPRYTLPVINNRKKAFNTYLKKRILIKNNENKVCFYFSRHTNLLSKC